MDNFSIQSQDNNHNSLSAPPQGRSLVPGPTQVQSSVSGPEPAENRLPVAPGSSAVVTVGSEGSGDVGASDRNDRSERRPIGGHGSPLVNIGDLQTITGVKAVSGVASDAVLKALVSRLARYEGRAYWRHYSSARAVACCGYPKKGSKVRALDNNGVWHFRGVERCKNPWMCLVCAAVIRHERSIEIEEGVLYWVNDLAKWCVLVTRTMQHSSGEPLKELMRRQAKCKRYVDDQTPIQRFYKKYGSVGSITVKELTETKNGYHPHTHELMFFEKELDDDAQVELYRLLTVYTNKYYVQNGFKGISASRGIDVKDIRKNPSAFAKYLEKLDSGLSVGMEMTRLDLKKGRNGSRTPFQIQADFMLKNKEIYAKKQHGQEVPKSLQESAAHDYNTLIEIEDATRGMHATHWKQGLHAILRPGKKEETDEDKINRVVSGLEHVEFENWYMRAIVAKRLDGVILAALQLDGVYGMICALKKHGIHDINGYELLDLEGQEVKTAYDVKLDEIIKQYVESRKAEKDREEFRDAIGAKYLVRHGWRELYEKAIEADRVDKDVKPDIVTTSAEPVERTSYTQGELDL